MYFIAQYVAYFQNERSDKLTGVSHTQCKDSNCLQTKRSVKKQQQHKKHECFHILLSSDSNPHLPRSTLVTVLRVCEYVAYIMLGGVKLFR